MLCLAVATAGSAVLLTDPRCLDSEWSELPDGNRGRGRGDSERSLQRLTLSMGLGRSPAGDLSLIVDVSELTMSAGLQRTLRPEAAGRGPGPRGASVDGALDDWRRKWLRESDWTDWDLCGKKSAGSRFSHGAGRRRSGANSSACTGPGVWP